jgi:hypothetical protein
MMLSLAICGIQELIHCIAGSLSCYLRQVYPKRQLLPAASSPIPEPKYE